MTTPETTALIETIATRAGWERPQHAGGGDYAAYRTAPYDETTDGRDLTIGVMWTEGGTAQVVDDCNGQSVAIEGETNDDVLDALEAAERIEHWHASVEVCE